MQNQLNYPSRKINGTNYTLASDGCFICSLAHMAGKDVLEVLSLLENGGGLSGPLVKSRRCAEILGLTLDGSDDFGATTTKPDFQCIAKVDFNIHTSAKEIHFVVWNPDGTMIDPYGNKLRPKGHYTIINYRLWHNKIKKKTMNKELLKQIKKITGEDYGDNLNDNEQEEIAEKLREYRKEHESLVEESKEVVVKEVFQDTPETLAELAKLRELEEAVNVMINFKK